MWSEAAVMVAVTHYIVLPNAQYDSFLVTARETSKACACPVFLFPPPSNYSWRSEEEMHGGRTRHIIRIFQIWQVAEIQEEYIIMVGEKKLGCGLKKNQNTYDWDHMIAHYLFCCVESEASLRGSRSFFLDLRKCFKCNFPFVHSN